MIYHFEEKQDVSKYSFGIISMNGEIVMDNYSYNNNALYQSFDNIPNVVS